MAASSSETLSVNFAEDMSPEELYEDIENRISAHAGSKRARQILKETSRLDARLWSMLHDHLVQKIIARLPFKSLFQALSLSKTWSLIFSSHAFQDEVQSVSSSWKFYSPLFVNQKKELVGYESGSKRWHRLPTHSYLPEAVVQGWCLRASGGSLLCWTSAQRQTALKTYEIHVSNPLTTSWRQLPPRPDMLFPEGVHVVCHGTRAYQVVLVSPRYLRHKCSIYVQIFDSTTGSWIEGSYSTGKHLIDLEIAGAACINGVVYMLGQTSGYSLISFDVKGDIWKEIPLVILERGVSSADQEQAYHKHLCFQDVRFTQMLVCGPNVMLVVLCRDKLGLMGFGAFDDSSDDETSNGRARETLYLFRLSEAGSAFYVSRAPNEMMDILEDLCCAAGQGDFIYIGGRFPSCRSIVYSLRAKEWHWGPGATEILGSFRDSRTVQWLCTSTAYEPGLNPFLKV